mgnify:FL=1
MKKLLEKDIEITAVYAISDVMAIGALRAILDKGTQGAGRYIYHRL